MFIKIDPGGAISGLRAIVHRVDLASKATVLEGAYLVQRSAREHASGRPGPNIISGDHRRSFTIQGPLKAAGGWSSEIGPTMPYSRRLELGFSGTDSLGRTYDQPPYPSLKPGFEAVRARLEELYKRNWAHALRG